MGSSRQGRNLTGFSLVGIEERREDAIVALPPKELYSIQDVADRWSTDVSTVEDYLCSRKLTAFIRLPKIRFYKKGFKVGETIDPESGLRVMDFGADVPSNFRWMGGLFALIYPAIVWDKDGNKTLGLSDRVLVIPDEDELLWLTEDVTINKQDIRIILPNIERFEAENSVSIETFIKQNKQLKVTVTSSESDSELNPNSKKTLLKMIIAMAICHYRYDPNDKKSDTPSLIKKQVERVGLTIDDETVRKWLKEAADRFEDELEINSKPKSL